MTGMSKRDYHRHRDRQVAYGRWQPWVDAGPAREHVRWLSSQGVGRDQVAARAGVTANTVSKLLYGESGVPPTRRIRPETEAALLAVLSGLDDVDGCTPVDATGTRRRLQGLAWQGWSMAALSARLGPGRHLGGILSRGGRVRASTARDVRGLCRDLIGREPPATTRAERAAAARTRAYARRNGWVPLAAWDDIDDPAAVPEPGCVRREGVRGYGILLDEVAELIGFGEEPQRAAERLGVSRRTMERALARGRRAGAGDDRQRGEEAADAA